MASTGKQAPRWVWWGPFDPRKSNSDQGWNCHEAEFQGDHLKVKAKTGRSLFQLAIHVTRCAKRRWAVTFTKKFVRWNGIEAHRTTWTDHISVFLRVWTSDFFFKPSFYMLSIFFGFSHFENVQECKSEQQVVSNKFATSTCEATRLCKWIISCAP